MTAILFWLQESLNITKISKTGKSFTFRNLTSFQYSLNTKVKKWYLLHKLERALLISLLEDYNNIRNFNFRKSLIQKDLGTLCSENKVQDQVVKQSRKSRNPWQEVSLKSCGNLGRVRENVFPHCAHYNIITLTPSGFPLLSFWASYA